MSRIKHVLAWMILLWLVAMPVMAARHGDTTILGKDYILEGGQELADNLVVMGGQVHLQEGSIVLGDVTILAGEAELSGRVEGDVVILGGTVTLGASAYIEGDVVVLGQLRRDPQATITGNLVQGAEAGRGLEALPEALNNVPGLSSALPNNTQRVDSSSSIGRVMANLAALLLVLLVAALAVSLAPEPLARLRGTLIASPLLSLGVGILTLAVVCVLAPILIVICIGIPVAIVGALAVALAALAGWVVAGQMAGERVTEWFKLPVTSPVGQALLGVLLISLLAQIPCLGPLAAFLVASAGIGAVVLTRFGAMTHPAPGTPAEAGASPAPVAPGSGPAPKPRGGTRPLDPFAAPDDTEGPH